MVIDILEFVIFKIFFMYDVSNCKYKFELNVIFFQICILYRLVN